MTPAIQRFSAVFSPNWSGPSHGKFLQTCYVILRTVPQAEMMINKRRKTITMLGGRKKYLYHLTSGYLHIFSVK